MGGGSSGPNYNDAANRDWQNQKQAIDAQTLANRPNLITPEGSMTWNKDPSGMWTGTLALSEDAQKAFDAQKAIQANQSALAQNLQGRAADALGQPMDWGGLPELGTMDQVRDQTIGAVYNQNRSMMDQEYKQREDALRNRIINEGGDPTQAGGAAAMQQFTDARDKAYGGLHDQSIIAGNNAAQQAYGMAKDRRATALGEMLQQRSQPLNEMQAVLNGQQVSMPNMPQFQAAGAASGSNFLGAAQMQGQQQMAKQQGMADMISGGMGLAGAGMMMFSDERLKINVRRLKVEALPGVPFAVWEWLDGSGRGSGVIAQDLAKVRPDMVHVHRSGFLMVDYSFLRGA